MAKASPYILLLFESLVRMLVFWFLSYTMCYQRETVIYQFKFKSYDETKATTHDLQIVIAKENINQISTQIKLL